MNTEENVRYKCGGFVKGHQVYTNGDTGNIIINLNKIWEICDFNETQNANLNESFRVFRLYYDETSYTTIDQETYDAVIDAINIVRDVW